jgi:predicted enzyme related to lactoylglutathione lyase
MWLHGKVPIGGVAELGAESRALGVRPHWVPTIEVRRVDDVAQLAQSLGGRVLFGPSDVPDIGRYASLHDPQGAAFAIFTPAQPTPAFDGTPTLGRFSWHELMATDHQAAFAFYAKLFEWEKISDFDMGGGYIYLMYGQRGQRYGGMYNRPVELSHVLPNWLSYVNVKDVRKTTAAAKRAGARLVNGPMQVPGGDWTAAFTDPQGAGFAIHERTAHPDQRSTDAAGVSEQAAAPAMPGKPGRSATRRKASPRKSAKAKAGRRAAASKQGARRAVAKGKKRSRRR